MAKRKRTRRFTPEFIEQAVRLVNETEQSQKDVAEQLGVSRAALNRWIARAAGKTSASELVDVPETPEEELRRLRKRVRELEFEKEILKKATALFAKESG